MRVAGIVIEAIGVALRHRGQVECEASGTTKPELQALAFDDQFEATFFTSAYVP